MLGWPRALAAGGLHGLLMLGAFPNGFVRDGLWPLALVAVTPLAWLVLGGRGEGDGGRKAARWTMACGAACGALVWSVATHAWIAEVSEVGAVPLIVYLAMWPGLFVWLGLIVGERWGKARVEAGGGPVRWWLAAALAVLWTGLEVVRGDGLFDGYAWYLVGHPLINEPSGAAAGLGALGGQYLASLGVAMAGCGVAAGWRARRRVAGAALGAAVPVVCMGVVGGAVSWTRPSEGGEGLRVGVVQTNVPQNNKESWTGDERLRTWEALVSGTRELAAAGASVVVWPEAMMPAMTLNREALERLAAARWGYQLSRVPEGFGSPYLFDITVAEAVLALSDEVGVPLLVNSNGVENLRVVEQPHPTLAGRVQLRLEFDRLTNRTELVRQGEVAAGYDKMFLAPFGETMPYISAWPWLERQLLALGASGMSFDMSRGGESTVFEVVSGDGRWVSVVTPICFEAAHSGTCRRLVRAARREGRAGVVMVSQSNDGWFAWYGAGREVHLLCARWRCAELGVPMVRAANTGVSAVVDTRGRVVQRLGVREAGVIDGLVVPGGVEGETVFGRTGNWLGWLAAGGSGMVLALGWRRKIVARAT